MMKPEFVIVMKPDVPMSDDVCADLLLLGATRVTKKSDREYEVAFAIKDVIDQASLIVAVFQVFKKNAEAWRG